METSQHRAEASLASPQRWHISSAIAWTPMIQVEKICSLKMMAQLSLKIGQRIVFIREILVEPTASSRAWWIITQRGPLRKRLTRRSSCRITARAISKCQTRRIGMATISRWWYLGERNKTRRKAARTSTTTHLPLQSIRGRKEVISLINSIKSIYFEDWSKKEKRGINPRIWAITVFIRKCRDSILWIVSSVGLKM